MASQPPSMQGYSLLSLFDMCLLLLPLEDSLSCTILISTQQHIQQQQKQPGWLNEGGITRLISLLPVTFCYNNLSASVWWTQTLWAVLCGCVDCRPGVTSDIHHCIVWLVCGYTKLCALNIKWDKRNRLSFSGSVHIRQLSGPAVDMWRGMCLSVWFFRRKRRKVVVGGQDRKEEGK